MEAGSSRSGGVPQVRCSASASQNVPGVRYLQRPRDQGRQVCGSGQVNSFVSTQEGSAASLLLSFLPCGERFYCRRRPHFFQQPCRSCFALRRDPLLPTAAKEIPRSGAGHFWPQRQKGPFRACGHGAFLASGGPISFSSERNGGKNAAKNPWFLDFLPPLAGAS